MLGFDACTCRSPVRLAVLASLLPSSPSVRLQVVRAVAHDVALACSLLEAAELAHTDVRLENIVQAPKHTQEKPKFMLVDLETVRRVGDTLTTEYVDGHKALGVVKGVGLQQRDGEGILSWVVKKNVDSAQLVVVLRTLLDRMANDGGELAEALRDLLNADDSMHQISAISPQQVVKCIERLPQR